MAGTHLQPATCSPAPSWSRPASQPLPSPHLHPGRQSTCLRPSMSSWPSRSEGTSLEVPGGAAGIPGWRPPKDPLVPTLDLV